MPFSEVYRKQAALVVRALPEVAREDCFALKGGTGINLFIRDMPRLSVDIDLTYLSVQGREQSRASGCRCACRHRMLGPASTAALVQTPCKKN